MNLLLETLTDLRRHGKRLNDIRWVGTKDALIPESPDITKAFDFDYCDGFGGQEVNPDLLVVGDDWWLERHEYDGSEWWEFKTAFPQKPTECGGIYLNTKQWPESRWGWGKDDIYWD